MNLIGNILLTRRFFWLLTGFVLLYGCGYLNPFYAEIAIYAFLVLGVLCVIDFMILLLFGKEPILHRKFQERLNLGDSNKIQLELTGKSAFVLRYELNEGFPDFMQNRSTSFYGRLSNKTKVISYYVKPTKRGLYHFNPIYLFLKSDIGLIERRHIISKETPLSVFPSVLQMKKYELLVFQHQKAGTGIKKVRRLGTATEFEQIRNYVSGDELKTINWKATSRKNELMVNQYQDEKSQPVYCIIDKSRTMQMEFEGMTILDYAINSTLVFSNICLLKGDKIGLMSYSDKLGTQIPADSKKGQMKVIMDALYRQQTKFMDANFELLQTQVRQKIKTRSLLLLFTNFENEFAMRRALPYLIQMGKRHRLVVIFFQNNDLKDLAYRPHFSISELYTSVVAERMLTSKARMAREMKQYGIQTILTTPQELSVSVINKYLEMKAKGSF